MERQKYLFDTCLKFRRQLCRFAEIINNEHGKTRCLRGGRTELPCKLVIGRASQHRESNLPQDQWSLRNLCRCIQELAEELDESIPRWEPKVSAWGLLPLLFLNQLIKLVSVFIVEYCVMKRSPCGHSLTETRIVGQARHVERGEAAAGNLEAVVRLPLGRTFFVPAAGICTCAGARVWLLFATRKLNGVIIMSRRCEICGKGPVRGNHILRRGQAKKTGGIGQHITAVTPRLFKPNLQAVHAIVNGVHRKIKACTKCLKSGRIAKAA